MHGLSGRKDLQVIQLLNGLIEMEDAIIFRRTTEDVRIDYLDECYRRVYKESIGLDGKYGDYDKILFELKQKNSKDFPYDDYYLPQERCEEIFNEVMNLPWKRNTQKTLHKLREYQKAGIKTSFWLGISPITSLFVYLKRYPQMKKYFSKEEIAAFEREKKEHEDREKQWKEETKKIEKKSNQ